MDALAASLVLIGRQPASLAFGDRHMQPRKFFAVACDGKPQQASNKHWAELLQSRQKAPDGSRIPLAGTGNCR